MQFFCFSFCFLISLRKNECVWEQIEHWICFTDTLTLTPCYTNLKKKMRNGFNTTDKKIWNCWIKNKIWFFNIINTTNDLYHWHEFYTCFEIFFHVYDYVVYEFVINFYTFCANKNLFGKSLFKMALVLLIAHTAWKN